MATTSFEADAVPPLASGAAAASASAPIPMRMTLRIVDLLVRVSMLHGSQRLRAPASSGVEPSPGRGKVRNRSSGSPSAGRRVAPAHALDPRDERRLLLVRAVEQAVTLVEQHASPRVLRQRDPSTSVVLECPHVELRGPVP